MNRHSALKVVKSAGRYAETARDEIKLLRKVTAANLQHPGRDFVVSFLDSFQHEGPEESHICMIFEPLGENLLALIERNKAKGVPHGLVKTLAKQMLLGLQYLHEECDLVHTDIKPENISEYATCLTRPLFRPGTWTDKHFPAVIVIPDVQQLILEELSMSPSPTSRRVGVPPGKSRAGGVTIPKKGRERHVQIFDSQPLPSPSTSSHSRSSSAGSRYGLRMSQIKSPNSSTRGLSRATGLVGSVPKSGVDSVSTSLDSSIASVSLVSSTPPTSLGSVMSKAESPVERGVEKLIPSSLLITPKEAPSIRPSTGPSLLAQTAPPDVKGHKHNDSETSTVRSAPTPTPPSPCPLSPPIQIKIADLGNATPSRNHFTEDIQTRQYRAPEAILGRNDWDHTADMWSVACVIFELLTAEYLFDPQSQGELFSKDDDHMAQIIELLGDFPLDVKMGGKYSREIFDSTGQLRYIKTLKPWPLRRVMTEKYLFTASDADGLCSFLAPMLRVDFRARARAGDMLDHPWLDTQDEAADDECL